MGITVEQWRASIGGWSGGYLGLLTASTKCRELSSSPFFLFLVLVVLLVIGGIEINPGPNQSEIPTFEKTKGFADMTGENYEVKMSALLYLRALQTGQEFHLASNMRGAGCFDDVVLTLGDSTVFLQLKHKKNPQSVLKLRDLIHDTNFKLQKYLESYLSIKQEWQHNPDLQLCGKFQNAKFVIYTNARVEDGLVNNVGNGACLSIVRTGGRCVCLNELFENFPKYKTVLSAAVLSQNLTATPELWDVVHKLHNKQAQYMPSKKQLQEMLDHIETLGDLTRYQQFISQLYLCTGQMAEKDLDHLIRREIVTVIGTDTVLREFMDGVLNWWRCSEHNVQYLTEKTQFWQDILNICVANIMKPAPAIKAKFLEEHCDAIRVKLTTASRMLYIHTQCTDLSCVKVLQSFQTNLMVDVITLETRLDEVLAVWKLGMCDVLVVVGNITNTSILQKLASIPDPKGVVVMSGTANHAKLYQQYGFVSLTDTFSISHLESVSQQEILEHEVMFQGFPVKLNSLAHVSFLQRALTADIVVQLYNTLPIGHKLVDLYTYYLPRTFLRREYVSELIFREDDIILAITGMSENRLSQLVRKDETIQKFSPNILTRHGSCRYFLIKGESQFTALCGVHDNIHWIHACAGDFIWKNSKGDMSLVTKHLAKKCISYAGIEHLVTLPHQVVLVVAEPGMGKTTEMSNIAHVTKQKDPSTWVIRVDLNQHTPLLTQKHVDAVEFLERVAILNTEFQRRLFEHQLQFGGNVVILLDGFDEVSPYYTQEVYDLLTKFFVNKISKIYITSRPVMRKDLEGKLSTLAFSFQSFTVEDQENFLMRYWNQNSINSPEISKFISSLLELVGTSLNDNLREFTGIPLQCRMLAEVFQDEASYFCLTGEVMLPESLNVLQLYDKFIEKKWEVYFKKLLEGVSNAMLHQILENQKLKFHHRHMDCALYSYFDSYFVQKLHRSENILKQNKKFINEFEVSWVKTGIVTHIVNDKAVFVHRTFTEYFVAMWFSKHLDIEIESIRKIYLDRNFEIITKFLDRIIAKELELHTAVLNSDLSKVIELLSKQSSGVNKKDKGGRTALHLAIMNYFYQKESVNVHIVETLLIHGADVNCEDAVLRWKPLRLAEEIRAWSVVDKLLEAQADDTDLVLIRENVRKENPQQGFAQTESSDSGGICDIIELVICIFNCGMSGYESFDTASAVNEQHCMSELLQCVMHTALCEGYVNLVEFILKCGVGVGHHMTVYGDTTTMLHIAAQHGQLELVQLLIEHGADVNIIDISNKTPLMWALYFQHVQVVKLLLTHGAFVNSRDKEQIIALLHTAPGGEGENVECLFRHTSHHTNDATALVWRVGGGDKKAMQYLMKKRKINSRDHQGNTALLAAVKLGKFEIVNFLIEHGADINMCDQDNVTPLMCAAINGYVQLVQLFISHGASVNSRNTDGYSALSLAARGGANDIVDLLLPYTSSGSDDTTALIFRAACGDTEALQHLIKHKIVNLQDDVCDTALLVSVKLRNIEIVSVLLEEGADVEIGDGDKITPLMWAALIGDVEVVQLLINHGASVNARDVSGRTALYHAQYNDHDTVKELLLQLGAHE